MPLLRRSPSGKQGQGFQLSEDDIICWQDLLDSVASGRVSDLSCPFCQAGSIRISQRERVTRLECPSCRHFIEGQFDGGELPTGAASGPPFITVQKSKAEASANDGLRSMSENIPGNPSGSLSEKGQQK